MKRQTRNPWMLVKRILFVTLLLSACSARNAPDAPPWHAQTIFSVSQNLGKDAPTTFTDINWSQRNRITIGEFRINSFPTFIGEIDTGKVFPFYMDNSVVSGEVPVISPDGNYLAFKIKAKLYIASMSKVISEGYSITPENIVSVFEERNRCGLAWSPNSVQLAAICLTLDGIKISLYTPGRDKPQDVFQYSEEGIDDIERVSWSPNAAVLAFSLRYAPDEKKHKPFQNDIFLYRLDTSTLVRVTNSPEGEQYPDWYPGKDQILTYTITPEDAGESVYSRLVFSTEDGKCRKEVPNLQGVVSASWSPDGSQLAYIADWKEIKVLETSQVVPPDFLSSQGLCDS